MGTYEHINSSNFPAIRVGWPLRGDFHKPYLQLHNFGGHNLNLKLDKKL